MFSKTRITRQQRYEEFEDFITNAEGRIKTLCESDKTAKQFVEIYSFYVAAGGRAGGLDRRRLEVFFGARPYDTQTVIDSSFRQTERHLAERGATLNFVRDDHGRVHITLHSAHTEGIKPIEDGIYLGLVDASKLKNKTLLASYFGLLVAYMQCTALEGSSTLRDRFTIARLRFWHPRIVEGRLCDAQRTILRREILKWALTVGFSGSLLAACQLISSERGPTTVTVAAEPPYVQQQRADLVNLGRENATRLEAVEMSLRDIRARLDLPLGKSANEKTERDIKTSNQLR